MSATEVAAHVKSEEASIEAEYDEEPSARTTTDRNGVRVAQPAILELVKRGAEETRDAETKARLAVLGVVLAARLSRIESAVERAARSLSPGQRYSPEVLDLSRRTHKVVTRVKRRLQKRLGKLALDAEVRKAAGVGKTIDPDAAMDVRDGAQVLQEVLASAPYAARFAARRINHRQLGRQLTAELAPLEAALARGLAGEVTRGEAGMDLHRAVRGFEIALERTVGELEDAGLDALATSLEAAVPKERKSRKGRKGRTPEQAPVEPPVPAPVEPQAPVG